jgi:hypothetical protein
VQGAEAEVGGADGRVAAAGDGAVDGECERVVEEEAGGRGGRGRAEAADDAVGVGEVYFAACVGSAREDGDDVDVGDGGGGLALDGATPVAAVAAGAAAAAGALGLDLRPRVRGLLLLLEVSTGVRLGRGDCVGECVRDGGGDEAREGEAEEEEARGRGEREVGLGWQADGGGEGVQ